MKCEVIFLDKTEIFSPVKTYLISEYCGKVLRSCALYLIILLLSLVVRAVVVSVIVLSGLIAEGLFMV